MQWLSKRRPSASMVVALIALVIASSGTAIAASTLVSGDSLITKHSLSGNRLRNHTLTGSQINFKKLGKVPSAKHADSAANATNAINATNATNASHATSATTANGLPALQWQPLSLINGWSDYNAGSGTARAPAIAVDAQGIVHLRGAITQTGTYSAQFAVIPTPFRPSFPVWLVTDMVNGAPGRIDIYNTGQAYVQPGGSTTTAEAQGFTNLDGITYALG